MRDKTEQVQTNGQLSEEELQRTQVLNLADFKETARIEKITSKKPALIVAIIGFLSISLGTIFPAVQSLQARKDAENSSTINARKEPVLTSKEEVVTCITKALNFKDTDQIYERKYTFENNELIKLNKIYTVTAIKGNKNSQKTIDAFSENIKQYQTLKNGYETSVKNLNDGIMTMIDINYETLDSSAVPAVNQANHIYQSEFKGKETKQDVISQNEKNGFQCSGDIENNTPKGNATKVKNDSLTCTFKDNDRTDGVNYLYEINYNFEDNKLVSAKKSFTMTPVANSELGEKTVASFNKSLAPYRTSIKGYTALSKESGKSVTSIIDIDYKTVQLDAIPAINNNSFIYMVDFPANTTKETVISQSKEMVIPGSKTKGFICK